MTKKNKVVIRGSNGVSNVKVEIAKRPADVDLISDKFKREGRKVDTYIVKVK